jgi:plastocyanin
MQLQTRYLPLVALLGAAAAVIPSIASSATPPTTATVSATESITWSPREATVGPDASVTFEDPSKTVPHGVVWEGGPETPACSGVPINEGRTHWKGTCTLVREGIYDYYCYVHGKYMSGVITVTDGTVTTTPTGTTTSATTGTTYATPTQTRMSMPGMTMSTGEPPPSEGGGTSTTGGSQGAGAKDTLSGGVLALALSQRGNVDGSLAIAQASSRLQVELLVPADELGRSHQAHGTVLAGRLSKAHLGQGRVQFRVPLSAAARNALARLGRLSLTVRIRLAPPAGAPVTRTLRVVLRR